MNTYNELCEHTAKLAVVGLGYVGMPLAVAFSEHFQVIGFDVNAQKIEDYQNGIDATKEVGDEAIQACTVDFTSDEARLNEATFVVVAVPTPINGDKTPDLSPVISASEAVGRHLMQGAIVVYESTVYPGVTEDICVPILEKESGLTAGRDFKVGYSPERINPGDKVHTLRTIRKVISGMDEETSDQIRRVYDTVVDAGTYPVSSIKTAEAIKLVENSQRDVNIAFMNEMAIAFERMGIDTNEVVDGMNTKWNALNFRPGLVGGHCIGVDPYYFVYEASLLGYTSRIVSASRQLNDSMGKFAANMTIKRMIQADVNPAEAHIVILGITFKENCPDIRNSKVFDVLRELREYNIQHISIVDPWADVELVKQAYGITLTPWEDVKNADCIIHAVKHTQFQEQGFEKLLSLYRDTEAKSHVLIDLKGEWTIEQLKKAGVTWWRM